MFAVVLATLANGLAQRPQPRRVDVRVPDRAQPVRRRNRGRRQDLDELRPRRGGRAVHVLEVDRVQRPLDRAQDLVAAAAVLRQLHHQLTEHLKVLDQVPDLLVEHGEVDPLELVLRLVPAVSFSPRRVGRKGW